MLARSGWCLFITYVLLCLRVDWHRLIILQSTFSINSLAHYLGDRPFDDKLTPRDNVLTALVTVGEGYHNFHHQFPMDYRNAIKWYQYDPTKWFIWMCGALGLAQQLKVNPPSIINSNRVVEILWLDLPG